MRKSECILAEEYENIIEYGMPLFATKFMHWFVLIYRPDKYLKMAIRFYSFPLSCFCLEERSTV